MTELQETINDFAEMRKSIKKPLTKRAIKILEKKLDRLAKTDQEKIEILEQSILNCWQGVFPLVDDRKSESLFDQL